MLYHTSAEPYQIFFVHILVPARSQISVVCLVQALDFTLIKGIEYFYYVLFEDNEFLFQSLLSRNRKSLRSCRAATAVAAT